MTSHHTPPRRPGAGEGERGSMSAAVAILTLALLLVIGLVVDGGRKLNAVSQAHDVAAQAAHAAAQQIDTTALQAGGGLAIDTTRATQAAKDVLTGSGASGNVTIQGEEIHVSATTSRPTTLLSLIGVATVEGTGSATVRIANTAGTP